MVTGVISSVTLRVATPAVGGSNKEGTLSSNNVNSLRKTPNDGSLQKLSKLMAARSSTRPCGVTGLKRIR